MTPILFILILAIIAIFSSTMTVLWKNGNLLINFFIKCIINFVIIYLATMSFALNNSDSDLFESLILLGIVAGFIADITLSLKTFEISKKDKNNELIQRFIFITKTVSGFIFMIALVYFTTTPWMIALAFGGLLAIFAIFFDKLFPINLRKYKYILPVYSFVFGILISQTIIQLILVGFSLPILLALIGFTLLLISDLIFLCCFIYNENVYKKDKKLKDKKFLSKKLEKSNIINRETDKPKNSTNDLKTSNKANVSQKIKNNALIVNENSTKPSDINFSKHKNHETISQIIYYLSQIIIASLIFFV